jgi:hypothetical protein
MNATPLLNSIVAALAGTRLEAILIGNAAAALWVADLVDIIASKRAAGRVRDKAVLEVLEATLREKGK